MAKLVGHQSATLEDLASRMGPDNAIAVIIEMLAKQNPMLKDMRVLEANNGTTHTTTFRTGLPEAWWRLLNKGVPTSKSRTAQDDFGTGILETWAVLDKALVELNGNKAAFMLSEHKAFLEGMNQIMAETLIYGNLNDNKAAFTGLAAYYSTLDKTKAESANNIINLGGTGANLSSAWLLTHGDQTLHMIHPKGLPAGLKKKDFAEAPVQDENGDEYVGLKTNYSWAAGLVLRDWRYCARLVNIPVGNVKKPGALGSDADNIIEGMIMTHNCLPDTHSGTVVWYVSRAVKTILDIVAMKKENVSLSIRQFEGEEITHFRGIPLRQCDAILDTEAEMVA